jgi:CBS domain-containing protein
MKAWKRIGVPGTTLIHSIGGFQAENWLGKIGLGGLSRLFDQDEIRQRTLFSVISDEELLERAISEADAVVEGFDRPHSGILFTVPVGHALGIRKRGHAVIQPGEQGERKQAEISLVERKTAVSQIIDVLKLEPIVVQNDASLQEIVEAMLAHPSVHLACVVNDEKRLVGVIDLTMLANGFFLTIFPEKFLGELQDLDQVLKFASQTKVHLAADLMEAPAWVKMEDDLEKAFQLMHERKLPGLPIVDDHYHIIGYINLLELMGFCLTNNAPGTGGNS